MLSVGAILSAYQRNRAVILGIVLGSVYGVFLRLIFELSGFLSGRGGLVMTVAFLMLGPIAMGYFTVRPAERLRPRTVWHWIFAPWLSVGIGSAIISLLLNLEGMICVVFALPITLCTSSIGGVIAGLLARRVRKLTGPITVCVALLPLLLAPMESRLTPSIQRRRVETQIEINAAPERVWKNIKRVPPIERSEFPVTWTQFIGFPRPLEANLSFEGTGGVRHASFEGGLLFIETITQWQPNHTLSFSIRADTKQIPRTTLDDHVTIGGRYFDVLDGSYVIEQLSPRQVVLHLFSEERLSTDFNGYAGFWSDAVMTNIQENILRVVKQRSERRETI